MSPLLTVATVCYNARECIEETIGSVLAQTDRGEIEYVIVDGGSTDGTLDLLAAYGDRIDRVVSEKDRGIYDAMNKSVDLARGEWILFMNAGDIFATPNAVERARLGAAAEDIVYGSCVVRYGEFDIIDPALPAERLYTKMIASHQSLFARTALLRQRPFDLSYPVCADYDFLCAMMAEGRRFRRLDYPVAAIRAGGYSDGNMGRNLAEKRTIAYRASGKRSLWLYWTIKKAWVLAKRSIKALLPRNLVQRELERKYAPACAYLIRLDDAHPGMEVGAWDRVEAILDAAGCKPLAAIIPECADPELARSRAGSTYGLRSADPGFWDRARAWQAKGWGIALHGHTHALRPSSGGLVPLNAYSEFVGLDSSAQKEKIRSAYAALRAQGLEPQWWVAPAHGFDDGTLEALRSETPIRRISDGLSYRIFAYRDFLWFPQQLWKPRRMPHGFWTICLHPEEMKAADLSRLENFLRDHRDAILDPKGEALGLAAERAPERSCIDWAWGEAFRSARTLKRQLKRLVKALRSVFQSRLRGKP